MDVSKDNFTFREYRPRTIMTTQIPMFYDSLTTETPKYLHHCSMYGFTKEDARLQARLGNTKYREIMHYSSELVIDTDNLETAKNVFDRLVTYEFSFELWKLNNYKFYLKRSEDDIPTIDMCFKDRQFVKELLFDIQVSNGLDLGIYGSPFHLCRAKGSIHEYTNRRSELVYTNEGLYSISTNDVELQFLGKPERNSNFDPNKSDWEQIQRVIATSKGGLSNKHYCLFVFGCESRRWLSYNLALELALIYANSLGYEQDKATRAFLQGWES